MSYSADDIVGRTLVAAKRVKVKQSPFDNAPTIRRVSPGATVGTVYSYLEPAPGRTGIYWMFSGSDGAFYVQHEPGLFDAAHLSDQFQEDNPAPWWKDVIPTPNTPATSIGDTLQKATTLIISIGVVALLIIAVPKFIKR